jgi:CRISPR/Cas system-associated exonuclease Cas4 (RecB family)
MGCPLRAKFNYIDKIGGQQSAAASFGTAVHLALEIYNLKGGDVEAAKDIFLFAWDNPEEFGITPEYYYPRTSYGEYRERGIRFIQQYHENNVWINRDIIGTEHRFCVNLGDHQISGIVDIIETDVGSNVLKIVDLKSGQRPNKSNLGYDIQFTAYMYAATQKEFWCGYDDEKYIGFENGEELYDRFKNHDIVGVWYDLRQPKNQEYAVGPRTAKDVQRLNMAMDQIAKAIEHEVFVPNISGDSCGLCSYHDICPVYTEPDFVKG